MSDNRLEASFSDNSSPDMSFSSFQSRSEKSKKINPYMLRIYPIIKDI